MARPGFRDPNPIFEKIVHEKGGGCYDVILVHEEPNQYS